MTGLRLRSDPTPEEWDRIVAAFPSATRYHGWSFLTEEAAVYGWRFRPLVVERGGVPVGVVPVLVERGLLRRTPRLPHPYVGPLVDVADLPDLLRALRRHRRRSLLLRMSIGFTPDDPSPLRSALRDAGWSVLTDRTYRVELRAHAAGAADEQVVLSCLDSKRRTRLRRARRAGVEVHRVDRVDELLPRTMRDAYRAHGGSATLPSGLVPWVDRLLDQGSAIAVEARRGDERLGVLVALRGGTALGWLGGVVPSAKPLDAGTALYHEMLRLMALDGADRLDLVGHVDDGVAAFKRSLGAEPAEFVEGTDAALPLRAAKAALELVRRSRSPRAHQADQGQERRPNLHVAARSA